jgi:uncharacterized protein
MNWQWDEQKSQRNKQKHGLRFVTAQAVFDDAMCKSRLDYIHTLPASEDEGAAGHIISARRATRHERTEYEESRF